MTMTVFVTGGAGYVGSHCCKAFAKAGCNVVTYDNLSRGWRDFVKWGPLIEGDILDSETLCSAIRETKPDVVAHFAALAYVGESMSDPALYYRVNSCGTLNLLEAMRSEGVEQLIFSSTCATYGEPAHMPISETCEQRPVNPYGWSKLMVERMLADFGKAYGLRSVALRYFNAAGADLEGEIGERHEPETHLIPLSIRATDHGSDFALTIFGDDFPTQDGTCVRDYIHVSDLATGHLAAIEYLIGGGKTCAVNLGTGEGTSVQEVISAVERTTGKSVRRTAGSRRAGDPPVLVADPRGAKDKLNWSPTHSNIETIVATAIEWSKK